MKQWNFTYVENFVWVMQNSDNTFHLQEYKYFQKSKLTLFIFRRDTEKSRKMDIRHQRNPDVYFDFVKSPGGNINLISKKINIFLKFLNHQIEKTNFAFNVVETL